MSEGVYERLGTRTVVNAKEIYTDLGGAIVSPAVWRSMIEANESFAEMTPLLDAAGRRIAAVLGVPAAWVTPTACARCSVPLCDSLRCRRSLA